MNTWLFNLDKEKALRICKNNTFDRWLKRYGSDFFSDFFDQFAVEDEYYTSEGAEDEFITKKKDELLSSPDFVAYYMFRSRSGEQYSYDKSFFENPVALKRVYLRYKNWDRVWVYLISRKEPQYYRGFRVLFGDADDIVVQLYVDALLSFYPDISDIGGEIDASYAHNNLPYYLQEVDENGYEAARYRISCVFRGFSQAEVSKEIALFRGMISYKQGEEADAPTEEEKALYEYADIHYE